MVVCGEAGICLFNQSESIWLPAPPTPIRETTKDAFMAGVIFAQTKTTSLAEQAAYGIALAELSVQRKGKYDLSELVLRKEFFASQPFHAMNRDTDRN